MDFEAALAAVRERCREFADPWWTAALRRLEGVRADPRFATFGPVKARAAPPWLVLAQWQPDPGRHQTVNVLGNHARFLTAHREAFDAFLEEAGLPRPAPGSRPLPLFNAFFFTDRNQFDAWHVGVGIPSRESRLLRTRITEPPGEVLLSYDTGAPHAGYDEDLAAFSFMATRWLLVERARAMATPGGSPPEGSGPPDSRVPGPWWLSMGLSNLFAGTELVSMPAGEWRFLRPRWDQMGIWPGAERSRWDLGMVLAVRTAADLSPAAGAAPAGGSPGSPEEFSAWTWALAHFLHHGKGGAYRPRYFRMIRESLEGRGDAELFHRAMETGEGEARIRALATLEAEIRAHVEDLSRKRPR